MRNENIIAKIDPFKDKLYRFAYKMLGNAEDAEDVIQELLIKVWKKAEYFISIDNQEAWCMTVTRNLSIDKIRARKQGSLDVSDYHFISDKGATPDRQLEDKDELGRVMAILDGLAPEQKEIILLRDVEGYSYKEIAKIIDKTEDQVKVNLYRARQRLKLKLEKLKFVR